VDAPIAEVTIDEGLVARLIQEQHPDLAGRLTVIGSGWDNDVYRLGDDLCVRLPRRRVAVDLILNEQRWLPLLADQVGVPIPTPVRVGRPSRDYPWPWTIGPWFDGVTAAHVPPSERGAIATDLARFVTRLHTPAPSDAPHNPVRGVALATRTPAVHQRLGSGVIERAEELREAWDELVATPPWPGPPMWLHGDPHPANILLTQGSPDSEVRLSAVLDFGDLTGGDPACDLAAAWMIFDAAARETFRAHVDRLSGVDQDTWARARGWALSMGTAIAVHINESPRMAAIGRHALDQVLLQS
jgi:aminoglycoside phosphotransferase (APT) family kinase protein